MGGKKNIDEFFQEHFKNFEASPPENAWENIQEQLGEKELSKKRMFPFWLKYVGVAASLVFFVTFLVFQFTSNTNQVNTVVGNNTNEKAGGVTNKQAIETPEDNLMKEKSVGATVTNKIFPTNDFPVASVSNKALYNSKREDELGNNKDGNKETINYYSKKGSDSSYSEYENEIIVATSNNKIKKTIIGNKTNIVQDKIMLTANYDKKGNFEGKRINEAKEANENQSNYSRNGAVAYVASDKHKEKLIPATTDADNEIPETLVANQLERKLSPAKTNNVVIVETAGSAKEEAINNQTIASEEISIHQQETLDEIVENRLKEKESAINKEKKEDKEKESKELPVEKTIEEAIAEQEVNKEAEEKYTEAETAYKKWNIAPNIAPVYYNSLTSGSPIDGELSGNKKKGQVTTSYGIGVGYAINKRLRVRTGINKLEVGYDTEGVALQLSNETTGIKGFKNVAMSVSASSMSIASATTYSASQVPEAFVLLFDSSLNQRLGYLEVPVELSYKLTNKKLKVDVIAGMSSFFLNKNEIYTENKSMVTYIGEANNLNNTVYSTNIGFGLEYSISKGVNFNFEPMFKYQLNAFSNDSGNFKPYILGLYTGFSYKF